MGGARVRTRGLEPLRPETSDPKSDAATNYATCAFGCAKLILFFCSSKLFGRAVCF